MDVSHTAHTQDGDIAYQLTRSKRKTIEVRIVDGEAFVRAPMRMSQANINAFIAKKSGWILGHIEQQRSTLPEAIRYAEGELFPFMGGSYPLLFAQRMGFDGEHLCIRPQSDQPGDVQSALRAMYQDYAAWHIPRRVEHYSSQFAGQVSGVRVREFKSQWGSCTAQNKLSFNTKLVLYPARVIDYVVVHELAHMAQRDHSRAFWALVANVLPDYKELRRQLKAPLPY